MNGRPGLGRSRDCAAQCSGVRMPANFRLRTLDSTQGDASARRPSGRAARQIAAQCRCMNQRDADPYRHAEIQRHPRHFVPPVDPAVGHVPAGCHIEQPLGDGHVGAAGGFIGYPPCPIHGYIDREHERDVSDAGNAPGDQNRATDSRATGINGRYTDDQTWPPTIPTTILRRRDRCSRWSAPNTRNTFPRRR